MARGLANDARRALDETGTNVLYLALGFLYWRDHADAELHRAPLLLIPVELKRLATKDGLRFQVRWTQEELESNLSLAKTLADRYGVILPEVPTADEWSAEAWLATVAECVGGGATGDWVVRREAVVDLFSFVRLFMYLDLDIGKWPASHRLEDHELLRRLLAGEEGQFAVRAGRYPPERQDEVDELPLVYSADAAQTAAILDVMDGHNLVVEGPPGTGKSQTIANLIGLCLARGKTVLFLAEKRAALEVVRNRLDRVALAPYLLELHGRRLHRSTMAASLKERIELRYRKPRGLESPLSEYQQLRRRLDDWAAAMAAPADASGESLHDVLWRFEEARQRLADESRLGVFAFPVLPAAPAWDREALSRRRELASTIADQLSGSVPGSSPWHGFWPQRFTPADQEQISTLLGDLAMAMADLDAALLSWLDKIAAGSPPALCLAQAMAELPATLIPAIPATADGATLARFAKAEVREQAEMVLRLLGEATTTAEEVARRAPNLADLREAELVALQRIIDAAASEDWSDRELTALTHAWEAAESLAAACREMAEIDARAVRLGLPPAGSIAGLRELVLELAFWRERTPPDASLYLDCPLFEASTMVVFEDARKAGREICELRKRVGIVAELEPLPDLLAVEEVQRLVATYGGRFGRFVFRGWRTAARQLPVLLKSVPTALPELERRLQLLRDYLRARAEFAADARYCKQLGMLFRGEGTDWEDGERILGWGKEAGLRASNELVQQLTLGFDATMRDLRRLAEDAERVLVRLLRLAPVVGGEQALRIQPGESEPAARLATKLARECERLADLVAAATGRTGVVITVADFGDSIAMELQHRQVEASLTALGDLPERLFGERYGRGEPAVVELEGLLEAARDLLAAGVPPAALQWLGADVPNRRLQLQHDQRELQQRRQAVAAAANAFGPYGQVSVPLLGGEVGTTTAAVSRLQERRGALDELPAWAAWCRLRQEACDLGLAPMLQPLEDGTVDSRQTAALFEWSRSGTLIDQALQQREILAATPGARREALVTLFGELGEHLLAWNRHLIQKALREREVAAGVARGLVRDRTELGLLRHESNKSRSHLPVRQLLTRAGTAMQALKPCFMMSPLAVSRFLPHELTFELLVVDEASQLRPEDCLGAVARCRQLVVVGDPKQLPPTSFFDRLLGDDAIAADDEPPSIK